MNLCNYKGCKVDLDTQDSGVLYLKYFGGYGDFKDTFFMRNEHDNEIVLCHKHAHKVFNSIYGYANYGSTSHHGGEAGFWIGHQRWETKNIITLLIILFRNPKNFLHEIKLLLELSKEDINDVDSKPTAKNILKNLVKFS